MIFLLTKFFLFLLFLFFLHFLFMSHLVILLWVYFSGFMLFLLGVVFLLDVLSLCFSSCCLLWSCSSWGFFSLLLLLLICSFSLCWFLIFLSSCASRFSFDSMKWSQFWLHLSHFVKHESCSFCFCFSAWPLWGIGPVFSQKKPRDFRVLWQPWNDEIFGAKRVTLKCWLRSS